MYHQNRVRNVQVQWNRKCAARIVGVGILAALSITCIQLLVSWSFNFLDLLKTNKNVTKN
jgi:hypothetical protein